MADQLRREPGSMQDQEYVILRNLVRGVQPQHTLEIGMGSGGSSVAICDTLREIGAGRHVAIDPFQSAPDGHAGRGMARLKQEGLAEYCEVIEDFDYFALPRFVSEGRRFDFVLIDGWHSFDYTLLDLFYVDLLLRVGGVVAIHDTVWPGVYRACRFLETHKPYERLSPAPAVRIDFFIGRALRRAWHILQGPRALAETRRRRTEWLSLSAYRKTREHQVPNDFYSRF